MSSTNLPFGLRPVGHQFGGGARPQATKGFIASAYAAAIGFGSPITLVPASGTLQIATAAQDFYGVFAGCQYLRTGSAIQDTGFWPASTSYVAGTMQVLAYDDPGIVYEIQASGSLAQTAIGQQADLNNPNSVDTTTGYSQARISTTLATTGNAGQLRIINLGKGLDNAWGDAFTVVQVQINRSQVNASKVTIV